MKKTIALVLVACMLLGTVVSVSAAVPSSFTRTLNLIRIIRTLLAPDKDNGPAYGELEDGILTIYVSPNGKADATGTEKNPFGTIAAARDAIRELDKADFNGINVIIKEGAYSITEAFLLTEEDSGTKACPIKYIGEDGATIVGGVTFTAKDFSPATGYDTKYFPEPEKIYQIDLKQFGYTAEAMAKYLAAAGYFKAVPFLSADAERQTLCRYPNDEWINIDDAWLVDSFGNETHYTDNDSHIAKEYQAHTIVVEYGDDHFDRVMSWKSEGHKYISGRLRYLWCHDDTEIINIDTEKDQITVKYVGAYDPEPGTVMYYYNIPEELDVPGEYYISEDAILYYYPKDNFDTAVFSFPVANNIVKIEGADYITFENLVMTSSEGDGIRFADADNLTIKDCSISSIKNCGIRGEGLYLTIEGNHVYDIGGDAIIISSGDLSVPSDYNNKTLITNNYVHNWSVTNVISYSITVDGINITVSHNTTGDSSSKAIHASTGVNILIEYNYVYNVLQAVEDCGAISGDGGKRNANMVYRYNYVHNVGPTAILETIREKNPNFSNVGSVGFYYDGMSSYFTTYGNVIANIDGHGYLSNAGRGNVFTGNLIINCSRDYAWASEYDYGGFYFDDDGKYIPRTDSLPDYVYLDEYKAVNPEPSQLILEVDENTDPYERLVKEAPANIVIKNNWCHFNRANRDNPERGVALYHVEKYVWRYSNPEDFDFETGALYSENANHSIYNSRRDSVDVKELITETANGVIEITWEQFEQIGVDPTQWNLDVELPEKVTTFEKG